MDRNKRKLYIQALESPYEKAIRLKRKLAMSSTHMLTIDRATKLSLNPLDIVERYPKSFKVDNGYVMFQGLNHDAL